MSKQENFVAKTSPATDELPQDVVEVHQDPEVKGQIIIGVSGQGQERFLQVPSSEELTVDRGIAQEFQQAAKLRQGASTAAAGNEGEKTHGDQL
jgi:hypothetical protein